MVYFENAYMKFKDLHSHLGSNTPPSTLWEIAYENGLKKPKDIMSYESFKELLEIDSEDLNVYLRKFDIIHKMQNSPVAVEASVYNSYKIAALEHDIEYLEIRFNPMKRNGQNNEYDIDEVISRAITGFQRASHLYGIKGSLILETDKSFSPEKSEIIAKKAKLWSRRYPKVIVGADVSGPITKSYSYKHFIKFFKDIKDAGLFTTYHCGEEVGSEAEMLDVMRSIAPDRIGHGVQMLRDYDRISDYLLSNNTMLEICPSSNIRNKVVPNWKYLSQLMGRLVMDKIKFTVNTDGPFLLQTNIKNEMTMVASNCGQTIVNHAMRCADEWNQSLAYDKYIDYN